MFLSWKKYLILYWMEFNFFVFQWRLQWNHWNNKNTPFYFDHDDALFYDDDWNNLNQEPNEKFDKIIGVIKKSHHIYDKTSFILKQETINPFSDDDQVCYCIQEKTNNDLILYVRTVVLPFTFDPVNDSSLIHMIQVKTINE